MIDKYQEKTGRFIVQYKETDWEFCKRLATNLSLPLIPEFQQPGKLFHIGINNKSGGILDSKEYLLTTSMPNESNAFLMWNERGIYRITSRQIHQLGEHIIFNKKRLTVIKIESYLQGSELWNCYYLGLLKTEVDTLRYNQRIQGVSMKGTVQAVQGTKVQVSVHEDENQTKGERWFDYATVYSSPDGTGWYCMPELGDQIRLTFPTEDENVAYVASSVHLEGGAGRDDPNQKFWRNKWGKEIRFTPSSLSLTNSAGLSLTLDDEVGIVILSNRAIHLKSDKEISMSSGANIQILGNNNISMYQGSATIQIADEINISGGKISLN